MHGICLFYSWQGVLEWPLAQSRHLIREERHLIREKEERKTQSKRQGLKTDEGWGRVRRGVVRADDTSGLLQPPNMGLPRFKPYYFQEQGAFVISRSDLKHKHRLCHKSCLPSSLGLGGSLCPQSCLLKGHVSLLSHRCHRVPVCACVCHVILEMELSETCS